MNKICLVFSLFLIGTSLSAQQTPIKVAENLVTDGIPEISSSIVSDVKSYTESRGASLVAWHPLRKEMLISTRFANSSQLHYVKMPGGDRKQITFFDEPISSGTFEPIRGDYFLYYKDNGGNEFSQIFRYNMATKKSTLLSDGKRSQNGGIQWSNKGDKIAYSTTKRNGGDRDIHIMNPLDSATDKTVSENAGGGWGVVDWTIDDKKLLIGESISINESRLYMLDIATGIKTRLLPEKDERVTYEGFCFSKDGKGFYLTTTKDFEFSRLAYFDLATKKLTYLTTSIPWEVDQVNLTEDGKQIAFVTNENGLSPNNHLLCAAIAHGVESSA